VYLITAQTIGRGTDELGDILMRSFVKNLSAAEEPPHALIFMNGGVRLTCAGSELLQDIAGLEARGTAVLSCGTCLDYFNLKDELKVGKVGGMAHFVELFSTRPTVTIS
jgi:selenium metabolism protein YedF